MWAFCHDLAASFPQTKDQRARLRGGSQGTFLTFLQTSAQSHSCVPFTRREAPSLAPLKVREVRLCPLKGVLQFDTGPTERDSGVNTVKSYSIAAHLQWCFSILFKRLALFFFFYKTSSIPIAVGSPWQSLLCSFRGFWCHPQFWAAEPSPVLMPQKPTPLALASDRPSCPFLVALPPLTQTIAKHLCFFSVLPFGRNLHKY